MTPTRPQLPSERILSPLGLAISDDPGSWNVHATSLALRHTLAYLDEQAARPAQPLRVGPMKTYDLSKREDCDAIAVDLLSFIENAGQVVTPAASALVAPPAGEAQPNRPLPFGGLCGCQHAVDHSLPHEHGCVGYRESMSSPSEDKALACEPAQCHKYQVELIEERDTLKARLDDIDERRKQELVEQESIMSAAYHRCERERDEAQAELTRIKADNERLSGELAAVTEELRRAYARIHHYREDAKHWRTERDKTDIENDTQRVQLTEARAALTKSELARENLHKCISEASERNDKELADEKAAHAETKSALAWERGWDLCRKAQMGAVVEAARAIVGRSLRDVSHGQLRQALSALDRTDPSPVEQAEADTVDDCGNVIEPATPPELPDTSAEAPKVPTWCECENVYPPCPSGTCPTAKARFAKAEAPREIKLHSTWRRKSDGNVGAIWRVYPDGGRVGWADSRGYGNTYEVAVFRERFEWVSDASLTREVSSNSGSSSNNGA